MICIVIRTRDTSGKRVVKHEEHVMWMMARCLLLQTRKSIS